MSGDSNNNDTLRDEKAPIDELAVSDHQTVIYDHALSSSRAIIDDEELANPQASRADGVSIMDWDARRRALINAVPYNLYEGHGSDSEKISSSAAAEQTRRDDENPLPKAVKERVTQGAVSRKLMQIYDKQRWDADWEYNRSPSTAPSASFEVLPIHGHSPAAEDSPTTKAALPTETSPTTKASPSAGKSQTAKASLAVEDLPTPTA
ncbi:hypothetical protein TruAng_008784 [Truncatella angustata]|nr:hypothetical protein TruAng_008784 [Truncatella angustata]